MCIFQFVGGCCVGVDIALISQARERPIKLAAQRELVDSGTSADSTAEAI